MNKDRGATILLPTTMADSLSQLIGQKAGRGSAAAPPAPEAPGTAL